MECTTTKSGCKPGKGKYKNLAEMVAEYIECKRPEKEKDREHFGKMPLDAAVENAALAKDREGKRSGHHRRRTKAQLSSGKAKLSRKLAQISGCKDFDELHDLVVGVTTEVKGLGPLYAYDTAYAIGIRLRLPPQKVYLHAGTRKGAKALKLRWRLPYIELSEMPHELLALEPAEIEDFLCIYEAALRRV